MNCEEYQKLAAGLVDGEVAPDNQEELFGHLGGCAGCRSFLGSVTRVRDAARRDTRPFPRFLDENVLSATVYSARNRVMHRRGRGFWARRFEISAPLASAAVIAVIVISLAAGVLLMRRDTRPEGSMAIPAVQGQPVTVIMMYSMPPVEVHGSRVAQVSGEGRMYRN